MQTIAFINNKGGTAKTTMSLTTASELAAAGARVLVIDTDPQGSLTAQMGVKPYPGFFHWLSGDDPLGDVLRVIPEKWYGGDPEHLLLIGGNEDSSSLNLTLIHNHPRILADKLKAFAQGIDFAILDTSPSVTDTHDAVYLAADVVVIPTQCDRMSVQGVMTTTRHMKRTQEAAQSAGRDAAELVGVLPVMFNGREMVQYQILGRLQERFGDDMVFEPVRRRTAWVQAAATLSPVTKHDPKSSAAKDARTFVDNLLERLG